MWWAMGGGNCNLTKQFNFQPSIILSILSGSAAAVGIGIIISSVTKQAGNNVNPTWPFYFEEIFCVSL